MMRRIFIIPPVICVALWSLSLLAAGCEKTVRVDDTSPASSRDVQAAEPQQAMPQLANGGAKLWGQSCMRCHNLRPPAERSDREWSMIVHHMRVRANLTAEEHRLIVAFLQAAN